LKILKIILVVFLCLIVLLAGTIVFTIHRSFPETSGELHLSGLKDTVSIIRDVYGVPHIYARNITDLFFAQGYVHAQDRFWQMDFWRHIGKGQLAELFGKPEVTNDEWLRMMGWARIAQVEVQQLDSTSRSILEAYSSGVNAYLADHSGSGLSLEHALLRITNRSYKPESWTPVDSIVWGKVMSWDLGQNLSQEIYRARLLKYLSPDRIDSLFPVYPADNPFILPHYNPQSSKIDLSTVQSLASRFDRLPVQENSESGLGSNNWVISGTRTSTHKPILANDPHLGVQMPSIWYQIHLQCLPQTENCRFNVAGFSFAGVPGVIIGHNQRIAWAMTNVGPDVMDLYIEKINPVNPNQYEVNGKWVDMRLITEQIKVANNLPVDVTIRYTRHGPIYSDFSKNSKEITRLRNADMPKDFAIALRWTALSPMNTFPAIWQVNLARNWKEFRNAASNFDVPSQNLLYADVDGNIGYQCPGKIPIRQKGDGTYPVPGWTDEYEWTGYIPFEELPHAYNPDEGYIASANNAVVSANYLSSDWDYGWRAKRIVELIESRKDPIDSKFVATMQGDNKDLNAVNISPYLLKLDFQDSHLKSARDLLISWDYQQSMDSPAAALFETFWKHLLKDTFYDDIPAGLRPSGGSRWVEVVRILLKNPDDPWWDDKKTASVEHRDDILREAFRDAVQELEAKQGSDPAAWKWGALHTVSFENQTFGKSGISLIEKLFNRGPFEVAGGSVAVNATSWQATDGFQVTSLPSMRMIVTLNDLNQSLAIHTTGQSGHPFQAHYIDMADEWRKIEYNPMLWDRSRVESNAEATLLLTPK
jgi:penicillin amidase